MKTIGYQDIAGNSINLYMPTNKNTDLFNKQGYHERVTSGLKELTYTGCIVVYLIKGNKYRKLFKKGY